MRSQNIRERPLTIRLTSALKMKLHAATERNGTTRQQEIIARLNASFEREDLPAHEHDWQSDNIRVGATCSKCGLTKTELRDYPWLSKCEG